MTSRADIEASIDRMACKAASLEADRARLSSAMWGIYHAAGFMGLVSAVQAELGRMAAKLGPANTRGFIG